MAVNMDMDMDMDEDTYIDMDIHGIRCQISNIGKKFNFIFDRMPDSTVFSSIFEVPISD